MLPGQLTTKQLQITDFEKHCTGKVKRLRTIGIDQWFSTFSGSSPGTMFIEVFCPGFLNFFG